MLNLDLYCDYITNKNPNMAVPWYLMSAYAYYEEDSPILSDDMFDTLAKRLLERWSDITHWHKNHITLGDLEAGTFLGVYPTRVSGALANVRKERPRVPEATLDRFF